MAIVVKFPNWHEIKGGEIKVSKEIPFTIEEIKLIAKVWNREIDCKEYETGSACPCAECQYGQICIIVTQKLKPFFKK